MKILAIETSTLMASVAIAETDAEAKPASSAPIRVLAWRESDVDVTILRSRKFMSLVAVAISLPGSSTTDRPRCERN